MLTLIGSARRWRSGWSCVLVAALALQGASSWEDAGGFILLALVVALLAVGLAPAHRRR